MLSQSLSPKQIGYFLVFHTLAVFTWDFTWTFSWAWARVVPSITSTNQPLIFKWISLLWRLALNTLNTTWLELTDCCPDLKLFDFH